MLRGLLNYLCLTDECPILSGLGAALRGRRIGMIALANQRSDRAPFTKVPLK
jgi:hypothetical protein